ncbi:tRNA uridine-5-carboxymethylaminomethyl(34) synthesis GTPase MnmE [Oceanibacterium hippocampi]|uniref:tRNA modification GTPase MnmE n=1 Tax=Oceanibacterium hippocampi TaxID=745714 RepID=A0A1Y5RLS7_9PROT|nr:tRNA uridine-5-carboxymethylaminomethyl(34) synthesis GTPase MnmE [Oceanibacterium hippocampi]SLN20511.1 tRNA modification GTPase MnmE [Oceanibacterium hippocampi]
MRRDETIYALSSGRGRAGIAVFRISGPAAGRALETVTGRALPIPRRAVLADFLGRDGDGVVDRGLALWFPGPASATGEDLVELHGHGGRAVTEGILSALSAIEGLRAAEPGEFTRRAVEYGKLDLTAAEAVADLVDAETARQREQALRQMSGTTAGLYEDWRRRLLRVLAYVEAVLDFPDEEVPDTAALSALSDAASVKAEIRAHLDDGHRGERLREGIRVTIVGAPNAGKSSLLNALARRDVAIVADRPGTTRDILEVYLDLGGYPVLMTDTAGLRESTDPVEIEGVRRARWRAAESDIRLFVVDATDPVPPPSGDDPDRIVVWNKIDCLGEDTVDVLTGKAFAISARSGAGLSALLDGLSEAIAFRFAVGDAPALTRARHREALERAVEAMGSLAEEKPLELVAEDLRMAVREIGRVTGAVDIEELLDVVFRDFCIGK